MDFAEILSSQCTNQEMKILKILLSSWTVPKLQPPKLWTFLALTFNHCNLWHFENAPV